MDDKTFSEALDGAREGAEAKGYKRGLLEAAEMAEERATVQSTEQGYNALKNLAADCRFRAKATEQGGG
jgi:hypothetical protein